MVDRVVKIRVEWLAEVDGVSNRLIVSSITRKNPKKYTHQQSMANDIRTIGVGNSGSGWERSGSVTPVNAFAMSLMRCAARGIPGTGLDGSDSDVGGEADEVCLTCAPTGTGGSCEDTA